MRYFIIAYAFILFIFSNKSIRTYSLQLNKTKKFDKSILFILSVVLFLIFALQSIESNSDLRIYAHHYLTNEYRSPSYFIENWFDLKDPFYQLCACIFSKSGLDFYAWHTLIGLFVSVSLYYLLKDFSANVYLSFLVTVSLGLFGFWLSGLRQTIAMAILMFTYKYMKNKKPLKFLLLVVLAALFHSSALVFIIAYPIYQLSLKIRNIILLVIVGGLGLANGNRIASLAIRLLGNEDYESYLESDRMLNVSGVIIAGFVLAFCIFFLYRAKEHARHGGICNLLIIAFFLRVMSTFFFAEMFRVSMYFSLFQSLAIAEACSEIKDGITVSKLKTAAVSFALFLYSLLPVENILNYVMR